MGDVEAAIADARQCWETYRQYAEPDGAKGVRAIELIATLRDATGDWRDINTRVLLLAAYNGDVIADELLRKAAYWLGVRGPVPAPLMYYVCLGKSKKGKRRPAKKTFYRNVLLAAIVHRIVVEHGFKPTRRRLKKQKGHSACSIVAKATKHDEPVVEKAWEKFGKWPEIASAPLSEELSRE
jgi:hypothetical protein